MNVKQLIEALKKLPPDYNVYAGRPDEGFDDDREVVSAKIEFQIACNDTRCEYVRLELGDKS